MNTLLDLCLNGYYFTDSDCRGVAHNVPETDTPERWYFQSPYLSFGDYDNSCHIERSNVRVFLEMFPESEFIVYNQGHYGHESVLIRCDCNDGDILRVLEALESYSVLNDEDATMQEQEMIREAWYHQSDDIQRRLARLAAEVDDDLEDKARDLSEGELMDIVPDWSYHAEVEAGGNVYINLDRIDWDAAIQRLISHT
jgi:hypothetical protein